MKLPIFIRVYRGDKLEDVKQFTEFDQIVIGRNGDLALVLEADGVSPLHSVIEERDSGYYISDLGSQTGTFKNGEKTFDDSLESGDELKVGPFRLEFFVGVPKPSQAPKISPLEEPTTPSQPEKVSVAEKDEESEPPPVEAKPPKKKFSVGNIGGKAKAAFEVAKSKTTDDSEKENDSNVESEESNEIGGQAPRIPESAPVRPERTDHGTYAPASQFIEADEVIKPGRGTTVEVVVTWKERIISTHHFSKEGTVTIGATPGCDIIVPLPGNEDATFDLVKIDQWASVNIAPGMDGHFYKGKEKTSISDLIKNGGLTQGGNGYEIRVGQDEMVRVGIEESLLNFYIRYKPEAPMPLVAPLLDLTASELTGVVFSMVVAAVIGLYMMLYSPSPDDTDLNIEEPIRKAMVKFNRPMPKPKEIIQKVEDKTERKMVKVVTKPKESLTRSKSKSGKVADVKPTKKKRKKRSKQLVSARSGRAVKTGKKASAPKSKKKDVSKIGLFGALSGKGVQKKLDKTFSGAGGLVGAADQATGFAGQESSRTGDNIGTKLKSVGGGGQGSKTVGISGVGTQGKGSGTFGYGSGGIGKRGQVDINIGGQEADFKGTIDREAIRRVIRSQRRAIKFCYERALARNKDLYGKLVLKWIIEEKGIVANPSVQSNSLGNKEVASCIIRKLKTWRFPEPPPDTSAEVIYPFVFTAQ